MDFMRFNTNSSREKNPVSLQKKIAETRRPVKKEQVPDLTDFMNDMFFGTVKDEKKYNFSGTLREEKKYDGRLMDEEEPGFDDSSRSTSSRLTQEWLQEARRMVASSPSRDFSSRLSGSPRFAAAVPGRLSTSAIERRDPLSRSARRHRPVEGISEEILTKSAKHNRNSSISSELDFSPTSTMQKLFSNMLKPSNSPSPPDPSSPRQTNKHLPPTFDPTAPNLPPRLSIHRRSRFQTQSPVSSPQGVSPVTSRRSFKPPPLPVETKPLSPPKVLVESVDRRSISSSTCSMPDNDALSPPRNLVESAHRRSISKSTCSTEKIAPKVQNRWQKEAEEEEIREDCLNGFLKHQRTKVDKINCGESNCKAKFVLSGPSNSPSSMVAAICYAWLLEKRDKKNKEKTVEYAVVPVMNVRRSKMWKLRQAAWLFHHVGLDTRSLLFSDEVDLENLLMTGQLSIFVVGQDVLRTNGEVRSECTILTDNYCEDAYELLQTPLLNKLLLAGILLDTQNLCKSANYSMTRDAEAVQLLLVGLSPNYRNTLFDQLMQDQRDNSFKDALLHNYGKPPNEVYRSSRVPVEDRVSSRHSTSSSRHEPLAHKTDDQTDDQKPNDAKITDRETLKSAAKPNPLLAQQQAPSPTNGKNKFSLSRWFGFGK